MRRFKQSTHNFQFLVSAMYKYLIKHAANCRDIFNQIIVHDV